MKHASFLVNWRAFARLNDGRFASVSALVTVLAVAALAAFVLAVSDGGYLVRADHAETPSHFVVAPGNGKLHVSWRPSPNHAYQIEWRPVGGNWNLVTNTPDIYRYEITGLANGTGYEVRVRGQGIHGGVTSGPFSAWTEIETEEPRRLATASNDNPTWKSTESNIQVPENMIFARRDRIVRGDWRRHQRQDCLQVAKTSARPVCDKRRNGRCLCIRETRLRIGRKLQRHGRRD